MRKNGLLLSLLILAASGVDAGQPVVSITNCSPHAKPPGDDQRQEAGPYRLVSIRCFDRGKIYDSATPAVSPDGTRAAWADQDGVTVVNIDSGRNSFFALPTRSLNFRVSQLESPITWAQDSQSLWATTRDRAKGGFPTSGGRIVRITVDGVHRPTTAIVSPSGPVDAVQWIPGTTKAIVQFGTDGGIYQPTHTDPAPELAMVDTATGEILDRLPLDSLRSFAQRTAGSDARYSVAAATAVVVSGRVHAIITIKTRAGQTWVHWTQGMSPVELAVPIREPDSRIMLMPSGKQFLRLVERQPLGLQVISEDHRPGVKLPEPPKPVTGVLLELKSLKTEKPAWSIQHTFQAFWHASFLEVSPDGRYALISWPDRHLFNQQAALIDLRTGTTAQIFPLGVSGGQAGFTENGSAIWIGVASEFRMYRRS